MFLVWFNGAGLALFVFLICMSICKGKCCNRNWNRIGQKLSLFTSCALSKLGRLSTLIRTLTKGSTYQFLPLLIGLCLSLLVTHYATRSCDMADSYVHENDPTIVLPSSFENLPPSSNGQEGAGIQNGPTIWFVVSTNYSLIQAPSLIRIAQALFPVRHFVTLVVVKHYSVKNGIEHLGDLDRLLRGFSIPYVLLSSRQYLNLDHYIWGLPADTDMDLILGPLTGITWVLGNVKNGGILMIGHEQFTYRSTIFHEIRETEKLSSWPVAFGRQGHDSLELTSPIVSDNGTMKGYFDSFYPTWDTMPIEMGALAINIDYFRQKGFTERAWMLAFDSEYSIRSLGFTLEDVQPLGKNCTKIYVWRTATKIHPWPETIDYQSEYKETNMPILMKNVFGVRFQDYRYFWN